MAKTENEKRNDMIIKMMVESIYDIEIGLQKIIAGYENISRKDVEKYLQGKYPHIPIEHIMQIYDDCAANYDNIITDPQKCKNLDIMKSFNQIDNQLYTKLQALGINNMYDLQDMTLEQVKNHRISNTPKPNRTLGTKCFIDLVNMMIDLNIGFKDYTPDQLSDMMKAYTLLASDIKGACF